MSQPLKVPAVLAFTVVGVLGAAATTQGCGRDTKATSDANTCNLCGYESVDNGNCPYPTCATGSAHDECPPGCTTEPIA